jgi:hypothetical protein
MKAALLHSSSGQGLNMALEANRSSARLRTGIKELGFGNASRFLPIFPS